jgi:hypothetical protein
MKTLIIDNFLSKKECNFLINFYKLNENKSFLFRDVYPIQLDKNNFIINFLVKKLKQLQSCSILKSIGLK